MRPSSRDSSRDSRGGSPFRTEYRSGKDYSDKERGRTRSPRPSSPFDEKRDKRKDDSHKRRSDSFTDKNRSENKSHNYSETRRRSESTSQKYNTPPLDDQRRKLRDMLKHYGEKDVCWKCGSGNHRFRDCTQRSNRQSENNSRDFRRSDNPPSQSVRFKTAALEESDNDSSEGNCFINSLTDFEVTEHIRLLENYNSSESDNSD